MEISEKKLPVFAQVQEKIGYRFSPERMDLLDKALYPYKTETDEPYPNNSGYKSEFSQIGFVFAKALAAELCYEQHAQEPLSMQDIDRMSTTMLDTLIKKLGIVPPSSPNKVNLKKVIFFGLMGAIAEESGMHKAKSWLRKHLEAV